MLVLFLIITILFLSSCFVDLHKSVQEGSPRFVDPRKVELSHDDWIDSSERGVLEALDVRLVKVLDQLIREFSRTQNTPLEDRRLIERIERRLYVFPFLCVEQAGLVARVNAIVSRVVRELHPAPTHKYLFDMQRWAHNRF